MTVREMDDGAPSPAARGQDEARLPAADLDSLRASVAHSQARNRQETREFLLTLRRALLMVVRLVEDRYNLRD